MQFILHSFHLDSHYPCNEFENTNFYISSIISHYLKEFSPGFDLHFKIDCCHGGNFEFNISDGFETINRYNNTGINNDKVMFYTLTLPDNELKYQSDWIFIPDEFEFKKVEKGYVFFPIDRYIDYVIDAIKSCLNLPANVNEFGSENQKIEMIHHITSNWRDFKFINKNKEKLYSIILQYHMSFLDKDKKWQKSEIGQRWLALSEKYQINESDGALIKK